MLLGTKTPYIESIVLTAYTKMLIRLEDEEDKGIGF